MLYNRTLLFIHSVYKSLHLLTPTSHSISPSNPLPVGTHQSVLYVHESVWQVYIKVTKCPSHADMPSVFWICCALFHLWPFSPLALCTHLQFPLAQLARVTFSVDISYGPRAVSDCPLSKPWNGDFQWGQYCFRGDSMKLMETFFDCFTMRCY